MNTNKVSSKLTSSIILALFFGVALCLRVYFPYDKVFTANWIKFTTNDAYHHMRLVDYLVHNFPHFITVDPYMIYPGGAGISGVHFFDWLLASIIWVIGLGSPTQHTIDVVSVYFPAILGALVVIPVYFIGKELFGHWAGVLSSGLVALMPGDFLHRSTLGSTDHHVAETLFTTVTILFLILALKAAIKRQLTFSHFKRRDWATSAKPVIYSLLTGISLGIYLLTWTGGLLFIFIISIYFVIQFIIDHLKGKSTDYLCMVGVIAFFIAAIIFLPASPGLLHQTSTVVALLIPLVLSGISRLMASKKIKPAYYPLTLVVGGLAGLAILYIINPSLFGTMLSAFRVFTPPSVQLTTSEMQPLLFPSQGNLSFAIAWGNFTTGFFFSFIALGILIYLVIKQGDAEKTFLVVWSLVILAATLGQRRFAYYFAVNVALLTGYLSWQLLSLAGFRELTTKPLKIPKEVRGKARPKKGGFHITISHVNIGLAVLVTFFIVFFPNIQPAIAIASQTPYAPSDAWCNSLSWLKENTPDPFDNPDFYYQRYEHKPYEPPRVLMYYTDPNLEASRSELIEWIRSQDSYKYPESAYGVMSWWDYGYWITRIAHRLPNTNPGQAGEPIILTARFFLSQDEDSAREIVQEFDSSYIIIDYETASSKFWAITLWAGREQNEFLDTYYVPQENQLVPVTVFYPEYYRSLSTRLYNFNGKAVTPESTTVISYQEIADQKGNLYKVVTSKEDFDSYEEAEAYLSSQKSANYRIVSDNPFISPVPLEAIKYYKLIHSSDESLRYSGADMIPEVKIFEYAGNRD